LRRPNFRQGHLLCSIDRFIELDGLRQELAPNCSEKGRPSIAPKLLIRMLIVGYCFGIQSESAARKSRNPPLFQQNLQRVVLHGR